MKRALLCLAGVSLVTLVGCKSGGTAEEVMSAGENAVESAGEAVSDTATSLVNVNLSNVLNDLALDLNIDEANIPVNAQIPITIAANVCGVSINILSVSTGGSANCTAQTTSPELAQVVQQQIAAGGSVGGGDQGGSTAGTSGTTSTTTETQPEPTPETNQQEPEEEPQ